MTCLSCGHCCKTISPINHGYCPLLLEEDSPTGTVYYCSDYENRPQQCRDHVFQNAICPVGKSTLNLVTEEEIIARVRDIKKILAPDMLPF